tara:strand:- start:6307 stop:6981 length:675 start_codon:yes stop_codon:yes gene_type:complete
MKITKSKLKRIITEELHNILAEQEDPGTTRMLEPGEREAMKRAAAGAETKKVDVRAMRDKLRDRAMRGSKATKEDRRRAESLVDILYPDVTNRELIFSLRQEDDEGNLLDSLFGFMFPGETKMNKPNPMLMDRVEEWIGMFKNSQDAALEVKGRSNTENLESLLTYVEKKTMDLGKDMFDRAKSDADSRPARNVPVGRAATPGTPERDALDALMSVDVPPKRRR